MTIKLFRNITSAKNVPVVEDVLGKTIHQAYLTRAFPGARFIGWTEFVQVLLRIEPSVSEPELRLKLKQYGLSIQMSKQRTDNFKASPSSSSVLSQTPRPNREIQGGCAQAHSCDCWTEKATGSH